MNQSKRYFCFGLGYTGQRLARKLATHGWSVAGTTRSPEKQEWLESQGIGASVFHSDAVSALPDDVAQTTHLLISIPPDAQGDAVFRQYGEMIATLPQLVWLGYLSTTGVYGDCRGEWVDESSPTHAIDERVRKRIEAEQQWLSLASTHRTPVHLFRLAGIYGPDNSQIDRIKAGTARRIVKAGQYFSRIHVDDIVTTLLASMRRPQAGAIYNVCDDLPAPPDEVVCYAARLCGVTPPIEEAYEQAELSDMMRSFYSANRRVRNDKIKSQLGVELAYPTYREGLAAIARLSNDLI